MAFDETFCGAYDFEKFLIFEPLKHLQTRIIDGRTVYQADLELRAYHIFIAENIVRHLDFNRGAVYSYREGINPSAAVIAHSASKYFIKLDLVDFFASVDKDLVVKCMSRRADGAEIHDLDSYITQIANLVTVNDRLAPGFLTSPAISNCSLFEFDELMQEHCRKQKMVYTRYSDDIVVSGQVKEHVTIIPSAVYKLLEKIYSGNFSINAEKIKFMHRGCRVAILGMQILPNGTVTLNRKLKHRVESLLHFFLTDTLRFVEILGEDAKKNRQVLAGHLNHIRKIDSTYFQKLEKKYGAGQISGILGQN